MLRLRLCLAVGALCALAVPALAASPQPQSEPGYSAPGTYELIPLPDSKVPAAWVLNTQTGQAWLCGPGAQDGRAHVTCLEASMKGAGAAQ